MGKRSEFNDIAYGLIHGFVSRNNDHDGYWVPGKLHASARRNGSTQFSLDLWPSISGEFPPDDLIAVLHARYGLWLDHQLKHHALPGKFLKRTVIELDFERHDLSGRAIKKT